MIGTGASAIQFVPAIADRVASLTVFQRTPPWIVPKGDRAFDTRHQRLPDGSGPTAPTVRNRLFWIHESRATGFVSNPSAMAATMALAQTLLERQVPDPQLRARLTPDYEIGCKRLLISSTWYPTLSRPDVDVRPGPIREVRPDAVIGADGVPVPADVIIYGTGFDTQHNLTRLRIVGRDGIELADAWKGGNEAYLGTTVAGFPNLFVMAGPNTGLGHNSQVFMIEAQGRYISAACTGCDVGAPPRWRCVRRSSATFNGWLQGRMATTVWQAGGCRSWYQDSVIRSQHHPVAGHDDRVLATDPTSQALGLSSDRPQILSGLSGSTLRVPVRARALCEGLRRARGIKRGAKLSDPSATPTSSTQSRSLLVQVDALFAMPGSAADGLIWTHAGVLSQVSMFQ